MLPLHVFEPRYRQLVRDLTSLPAGHAREFGVVAIRRGWEVARDAPGAELSAGNSLTLYEIGCTAEIRQITEHPDGRFELATVGRRRFRVLRVEAEASPYLTAEVEWLDDEPEPPGVAAALVPRVHAVFRRYLRLMHQTDSGDGEQLPDDPAVLSHLIAATASFTLDDRQRLLAEPNSVSRLGAELGLLRREVGLLKGVRAVPVPLTELAVPSSPN